MTATTETIALGVFQPTGAVLCQTCSKTPVTPLPLSELWSTERDLGPTLCDLCSDPVAVRRDVAVEHELCRRLEPATFDARRRDERFRSVSVWQTGGMCSMAGIALSNGVQIGVTHEVDHGAADEVEGAGGREERAYVCVYPAAERGEITEETLREFFVPLWKVDRVEEDWTLGIERLHDAVQRAVRILLGERLLVEPGSPDDSRQRMAVARTFRVPVRDGVLEVEEDEDGAACGTGFWRVALHDAEGEWVETWGDEGIQSYRTLGGVRRTLGGVRGCVAREWGLTPPRGSSTWDLAADAIHAARTALPWKAAGEYRRGACEDRDLIVDASADDAAALSEVGPVAEVDLGSVGGVWQLFPPAQAAGAPWILVRGPRLARLLIGPASTVHAALEIATREIRLQLARPSALCRPVSCSEEVTGESTEDARERGVESFWVLPAVRTSGAEVGPGFVEKVVTADGKPDGFRLQYEREEFHSGETEDGEAPGDLLTLLWDYLLLASGVQDAIVREARLSMARVEEDEDEGEEEDHPHSREAYLERMRNEGDGAPAPRREGWEPDAGAALTFSGSVTINGRAWQIESAILTLYGLVNPAPVQPGGGS